MRRAILMVLLLLAPPAIAADIGSTTWSETAASNTATPPGGWPDGQAPSTVKLTAREMMAAIKRWWDQSNATVTSGGSANAQTLTYTVVPTAYYTGQKFVFIAGFTNTATATLKVNTLDAKTFKIGSANLAGGEIRAGQIVTAYYDGTNMQLASLPYGNTATAQSQVAAPTGTTDSTGKMMGLAGSITPAVTGKILLVISGDIANGTSGDGAKVQASYGTGTAPSNGATITGTQCGARPIYLAAASNAASVPFSVNCVVTGLTVGTAHWLDVTLAAITGGTAAIANVSISATELR